MGNLEYEDGDTTIMPRDSTEVSVSESTEPVKGEIDTENTGEGGNSADQNHTTLAEPKQNAKLREKLIDSGSSAPKRLTLSMAEFKHIYVNEMDKEIQLDEAVSPIQKVIDLLTLPGKILCMVMIPNVDEEMMEKWYVPLMPLVSMAACIILTKSKVLNNSRMGL